MKVPLLDLRALHGPIEGELIEALAGVVRSGRFILGPEVERLESEVGALCGTRFAVGMSSGTDALLAALMAAGVGPGDEVITTPFSFFATAGVIARLGARPVFVDIEPASFNLRAEAVAAAVTPRTRAIIPVHLFGRCADMEPILARARDRGVAVVEDAAQAIGARDARGRPAGAVGQIGCLSFFPSKNLGGLGDGGMAVTDDEELARALRRLRAHGSEPKYYHREVGGNFRLDALQAAALTVKLRRLGEWTEGRRANAVRYRALFAEAGLTGRVALPEDVPGHVYNQFVIRTANRDGLQAFLKAEGVGTEVYYPLPLHLQECFQELGYDEGDFREAEAAAREALALPVSPEVTEAQQRYVVDRVRAFLVA